MKQCIFYPALLSLLLILGSCIPEEPLPPRAEPWLCSINADGTGFRSIKRVDLSFGTTGFWDIYMTKDNKIIFYGPSLWVSDPDSIRPVQITPDNITLTNLPSRLSQSPDGSNLFFAADKNIYQLSYPGYKLTQLTNQSIRWLRNPIVSDLGNYVTYSSGGYGEPSKFTEYMYWLKLTTGETGIIPCPDTIAVNPCYSETDGYVYYEKVGVLRSRLDGSDLSTVDSGGGSAYPYTMFGMSKDQRYIVHKSNPSTTYYVRIFDRDSDSGIDFPVKNDGSSTFLGAMSKEADRIFYVSPGYPEQLHLYNLNTGEDTVILQSNDELSVTRFINIAPTWDGSKVYFYGEVFIH
jgi:hypothetical protein